MKLSGWDWVPLLLNNYKLYKALKMTLLKLGVLNFIWEQGLTRNDVQLFINFLYLS